MHGSEGGKAREGLPIPIFTAATLIIAVPTGIKIWATVRVCVEMLPYKEADDKVELIEDYSAYSDSVMIGGQEPALKRIMRTFVDTLNKCTFKIDLEVIG